MTQVPFQDRPPHTDRLNAYDEQHLAIYLRLLMAEEEGAELPVELAHIARDPFDPDFDLTGTVRRIRSKRSSIKRVLLDQTVTSGIGNIYADEALWRAQVHGARHGRALSAATLRALVLVPTGSPWMNYERIGSFLPPEVGHDTAQRLGVRSPKHRFYSGNCHSDCCSQPPWH